MSVLDWMQPRDHVVAARTVSTLCAVAAVVTVIFLPIAPAGADIGPLPLTFVIAIVVLAVGLSWSARFFDEANRISWTLCPLLAVTAIVLVDLMTGDSSIPAQVFFLFPTLYGASMLRRPGVVLMTAASLVGELIVVGVQLPVREALTNGGYVAAALVTTAVLLGRASEKQDMLVETLERQAAIDPLTGLVTRRVLDEAATSALSASDSAQGTSLILLDVDNFKSLNDRYGHPGGDQVLVQLAALLGRNSRRGDVVCRMGGDEIAVLMPGCSPDSAYRRAEQIVTDVRAHPFAPVGVEVVQVTVSVGLAHAPADAASLQTLYASADSALYQAKHSGRDRVAVPTHRD